MNRMFRALTTPAAAILALLGLGKTDPEPSNHISRNGKASYGPGRARRNHVGGRGRGSGRGNTRVKLGAFKQACYEIQAANAEANARLPSYRRLTTNIKKIRHAYRKELA